MYNRRWYDSHKETNEAFKLLKELNDEQQKQLAGDLIEIIEQIKNLHKESESLDVSIGLQRVLGLYQETVNQRRWYDTNENLRYAIRTMTTLPEEDFVNIMEGLSISLGLN